MVISAAPRVLPLVDRTVVTVGTDFGHLMFWDTNNMATVRPPLCARSDGMFWYHPHCSCVRDHHAPVCTTEDLQL